MRVGWRRLSTESAGVGEKRRRLTGLDAWGGFVCQLQLVCVCVCVCVCASSFYGLCLAQTQCSNCRGVEPPSSLERPIALLNFNPLGGSLQPPSSLAMNGLLFIITRPPSTIHYASHVYVFTKLLVIKNSA